MDGKEKIRNLNISLGGKFYQFLSLLKEIPNKYY